MKKLIKISILSFLFLFLTSCFEHVLRNVSFAKTWSPLLIGFIILALSGGVALFIKKSLFIDVLCFLSNSVALGFCMRTWYLFREFDNSLLVMSCMSLLCVLYLWIFYLLSYIPIIRRHFKLYFWLYLIISLIIYIILILFTKTTYISTLGYFSIIEISFIFAICMNSDDNKDLFRKMVISTYSVLIVGIIIALIMFEADLDILEGLSIDGEFSLNPPDKNKKST